MNLEQIVASRLIYWGEQIASQINSKWDATGFQGDKLLSTELSTTPKDVILAIIGSGEAAWILEYGSGHLMDTTNPYLQDYLSSDRWNQERSSEGNEFIGRAEGDTVYSPDGSTYQSSGKAHKHVARNNSLGQNGLHLEHDLNPSHPAYKAQPPMHIIETELKFMWPMIVEDINAAVAEATTTEIASSLTMDIYI